MKNLKLNPAKIKAEVEQFQRDLQQSSQVLEQIKRVDVGQTPKELIFQQDSLKLFYFSANSAALSPCQTPLLVSYALVNRWYMVDLQPERSLLKALLDLGIDIYVIDWGYADAADQILDLDDYINGYLNTCVAEVAKHANVEQLNLLGICQGGTMSLCYTALYPNKIKNLITMVTPVDFHTEENPLSGLARYVDADLLVESYGNIPGYLLNATFHSLMPMRLGAQKWLGLPAQLQDEASALNFLRMEKWISDSPDQAGEAVKEFITEFFQQNGLIQNTICLGGNSVYLENIRQPVLNIFGTFDHIVPPSASLALKEQVSSQDYQTLEVKAGHIGVFVSEKSQQIVAPSIHKWLVARDL